MKKIRIKLGDIVEILVHQEYYCYAQVLQNSQCVFFDYKTGTPLKDYSVLNRVQYLFRTTVYNYVFKDANWKIVGNLPVKEELLRPQIEYIYHSYDNTFELYNTETGEMIKCTKEEARGHERCAVWGNNHIEDRIYDHYLNRPCVWMKEEYELWGEPSAK